jgi:hypothetical protein
MSNDVEYMMQWMNARHFVTNVLGKTVVGTERDRFGRQLPLQWSSFAHLREKYSNRTVRVPGKTTDGKPSWKEVPLGTWWLNHPDRRQYDQVGYWPKQTAPDGAFNLWRGFTVSPKPGDWGVMQEHIRDNICRGDEGLHKYVLQWLGFLVQKPWVPPGVAMVMRGAKGTGKGTLANGIGGLFGPHFSAVSNSEHVTGKFNAHFLHTSLLFIDEGFWAGDKRAEGVLKQLITEPTLPIERKFFDVENVPNRLHVIMASNEDWVVPARGMERRFLVLDLDDKRAQDTKFFGALYKQLANGGLAAMLHDLLNVEVAEVDVRKAPRTAGLAEQLAHSLDPFEEWWLRKLQSGRLSPNAKTWHRISIQRLYEDYREEVGDKWAVSRTRFGLKLRAVVRELSIERPREGGSRVRMYYLPSLEECRAEWDRTHGDAAGDWPTEETSDD